MLRCNLASRFLLHERAGELEGKHIGLVTNMTGVDRELRSDVDLLAARRDFSLVALFGPEHGVHGDVQAGDHVESSRDAATGLPVHSLYGEHREPTAEMLRGIDLLLFDIQDVGARYYTYPYTLANVLRAAKKNGIPVWVLDRPNPLGGEKVEGPVLEPAFSSFVGMFPIPVRHGLTIGELARLFNAEFGIGADLTVVKMHGWRRDDAEPGGTLPWVPPSPNMPTRDTALVYPGTALLEGTNVSEGRGTTRPFETVGAPFVDARRLTDALDALGLPGVRFRPTWFTPSFSKHAGKLCGGVQIHVVDRDAFQSFRTGLAVVKALHDLYPQQFRFQSDAPGASPGFFDKLAGNAWIREGIERGESLDAMEQHWQPGLRRFEEVRQRYLLYP
ncbi:MAG: DUF1343 domain-containing protein [Pseudoxanthomonas sp.]